MSGIYEIQGNRCARIDRGRTGGGSATFRGTAETGYKQRNSLEK